MKQIKLWGIIVLALLAAVVVFQNRADVETHFLFVSVTLPRAVLLVVTLLIGFALGVLTGLRAGGKSTRR